MNDIKIILSSDYRYEKLVAEIFYKNKFIALLNQDNGMENLVIEFPKNELNEQMILREIDINIFQEALDLAKKKLLK